MIQCVELLERGVLGVLFKHLPSFLFDIIVKWVLRFLGALVPVRLKPANMTPFEGGSESVWPSS